MLIKGVVSYSKSECGKIDQIYLIFNIPKCIFISVTICRVEEY